MKKRPSQGFLLWLSALLLTGGVVGFIWKKANSVPEVIRAKAGFIEALEYSWCPKWFPVTPEEKKQLKWDAIVLKTRILGEFPALKVAPRPVPDEENGFLQLHLLAETEDDLPVSKEIYPLLSDNGWNSETAVNLLEENAQLVNRIEHIAALPRRSSSRMPKDFDGFARARNAKLGADLLLLKARLAAEAGDDAETLRLISATQNLASHFREIECPNFLTETVTILIDLSVHGAAFDSLLPALGKNADLPKWKKVLGCRSYTTADFANMMRGEWNTSADYFGFELLLEAQRNRQLQDAEATAWMVAAWTEDSAAKLRSTGLWNLGACLRPPAGLHTLSQEGQAFVKTLAIATKHWDKGYLRSAVIHARYQAALDLLILEKDGATLTAQDAERATRDPVSGKPFVFDPAVRTLGVPPGSLEKEEEPLKLPW